MKLNVNTRLFQTLVSKSMKCASCIADTPITGMMAIEVKDNVLTLTTTNENTYLYVNAPCTNEDFYVVVEVEVFSKLIAKLTSESMSLELVKDTLVVHANGKYTIGLPYDSEGELVKFPDRRDKLNTDDRTTTKVNLSTLRLILATAKASLDTTKNYYGCYTGYYLGDKVVATDSYKICMIKTKVFDTPVLVRSEMMDLVELLEDEDVEVVKNNDYIMFSTDKCTIFGQVLPFLEDFQIDAISELCEQKFNHSCQIEKGSILSLLDRLSLFVTKVDENGILLDFDDMGIRVTSKQDDSTELIHYVSVDIPKNFSCCVDIEKFADQIKSTMADTVELYFGEDNALKIVDGNVIKIIALFEQ